MIQQLGGKQVTHIVEVIQSASQPASPPWEKY